MRLALRRLCRTRRRCPMSRYSQNRCLDGAIGALVGLVIGVALAWLLAAPAARKREEPAESQADVDDDFKTSVEVTHDDGALSRTGGPPHDAASDNGAIASARSHLNRSSRWRKPTTTG